MSLIFNIEMAALKAAIRSAVQPWVISGATTPANADEMADAAIKAIEMLDATAKKPPQDPGAA